MYRYHQILASSTAGCSDLIRVKKKQLVITLSLQHASLAVRVEKSLCSSKELSLEILEEQTDLAVQCEPDRCSLEGLQERQDHLEVRRCCWHRP